MWAASSDNRNATSFSDVLARGRAPKRVAFVVGSGFFQRASALPGAMVLTRMPWRPTSCASDCENTMIAALAAE